MQPKHDSVILLSGNSVCGGIGATSSRRHVEVKPSEGPEFAGSVVDCFRPTRIGGPLQPRSPPEEGKTRSRVHACELLLDAFLKAFDSLGVGVLLVGRDCRILLANAVATGILHRKEELARHNGRLQIRTLEAHKAFIRKICSTASTRYRRLDADAILAIPRSDGHCSAMLIFCCHGGDRADTAKPAAVVLISDHQRDIQVNVDLATDLYALTRAEARLLAALVQGKRLSAYAQQAQITLNTARKYLHQLFQKTGKSRQADLIRLLVSDPVLRAGANKNAMGET
jgi:DNA-binding CsgD family transcriptional regulator